MQSALPTSSTLAQPARLLAAALSARAAIVVGATLFVAACAHISIPLPFTPVPLTLQNFAVLLVGLLFGPAAGFATMALYLTEGALGLPVFNPAGAGGVLQLLGPTGGYLLSYPLVAAAAGWTFRSVPLKSLYGRAALAGTIATVILFSAGSVWMAQVLHLSSSAVWAMAIVPFLPGEIVKIAAAAGLTASLQSWSRA
jgi:biotin transport system substrate-specific component